MRRALAALVCCFACVPPPQQPEPQGEGPPAPEATLESLRLEPAQAALQLGQEISFTVYGRYDDGAELALGPQASLQSSDPAVLTAVGGQEGRFRAVAIGSATVRAQAGVLEASSALRVEAAPRTAVGLRLTPGELHLALGATGQVAAALDYSDGSSEEVTAQASWSSSAPGSVTVSAGLVRRLAAGEASVEAQHLGLSATLAVHDDAAACSYPPGPTAIGVGSTMPAVSWAVAYQPDGSRRSLSLEEVHCAPEYAQKTVIAFVVGAGWCGPCTEYARELNLSAAQIEGAGALLIYVEAEDADYQLADSAYADRHLRQIIQAGPGIRVGDAETQPTAGVFDGSPLTTQFPTAFVVRKRDMKIIANQADWGAMLPYAEIARNAEADWSDPRNPPQQSNCGAADEEPGEPNDSAAQATLLAAGTLSGGVCNGQPDFFRVELSGSWRFDLSFSHSTGDLDVFVWDEQSDQPLTVGGQQVGSDSGDDDESFTHAGPALVKVYGYRGASAPYRLSLTPN